MVRARVRADLERLVDLFHEEHLVTEPGEPAILALTGHDYPYRIVILKAHWAALVMRLASDIDYSNFKSAVESQQETPEAGKARHDLYMKIWGVMHGAEKWLREHVVTVKNRGKGTQGGQGSLSFWGRPGGKPSRGWEDWLEEDEERAVVCDLPEGTPTREEARKGVMADVPPRRCELLSEKLGKSGQRGLTGPTGELK